MSKVCDHCNQPIVLYWFPFPHWEHISIRDYSLCGRLAEPRITPVATKEIDNTIVACERFFRNKGKKRGRR